MIYIDLIELYLLFSRACHTNDVPLFVYCLGKMYPVFLSAGRPNYSWWMVKYNLNLLNAEETQPGITEVQEKSGLTIRRTSKSFSRCPMDLTLEQTVNADAASFLTGIAAFTKSIRAREKFVWPAMIPCSFKQN